MEEPPASKSNPMHSFPCTYNYVVLAQKPTAVNQAVVGTFTGPKDLNLIISYDSSTGEIVTRANGEVQDRVGKPVEVGQIAVVDPQCRMIGLHLYDGLFKVIPIDSKGHFREAFNIRMEELKIIDIKMVSGPKRPCIGVLYQDTKEARHLKTYEIVIEQKELAEGPVTLANLEPGASMLIPVPLPLGGLLIVGEQSITYQGLTADHSKVIPMRMALIKCYGKVDPDGSRCLLGDQAGNLYVLILQHANGRVRDMRLELLGQTSIASTLSYLDNRYVFVGSLYGDSQLIRLRTEKDESNSFVEIIETYPNLGPIVDFAVVDLERQGQLVTCSGAFKDGSLRIIRNGIGINEQASIELGNLKGLWSLRPSVVDAYDKYLIVSFVGETRFLSISGEELEETEIPGFDSQHQTIFCGNVGEDQAIQVTPTSVRLISCNTLQLQSEWRPEAGSQINLAACNPSQVVLAVGGTRLVYLEIQGKDLKLVGQKVMENEISCINVNPLNDATRSSLVAVGLWTDISVRLLTLPDLKEVVKELLGGEIIPRSLLFITFEGVHYLLCALGDGHLFNWVLDPSTVGLSNRKKVSLGTKPIVLTPFRTKNSVHVFAASDRPTVIYSSNKRLLYSTVNLKEVNQVCPFNTASYQDCLAIAGDSSLTIGSIDEIQKLHMRSIPLGEMPRRIAHQEASRKFLLLSIRIVVQPSGEEVEVNNISLIDDQTFETLQQISLEGNEVGSAVTSMTFADDPTPYFVVGTAFVDPNEPEPSRGRILLYSVSEGRLVLVAEKEVKGCPYSVTPFGGRLATGINSKIQIWRLVSQEDGSKDLQVECSHHGNILALYLATRGDFIVVGDLMKSISLLAYKSMDQTLEEIARDYNPNWMTAVEILDDDIYIGAENSFNLFTVRKNSEATTDEERGKLETVGEYHLGEFVNRFRHGSLVMRLPESEAMNLRTLLFVTVSGAIGVVASLPQDQYEFFLRLEEKISQVIKGIGGFDHKYWRSFSNERKTVEKRNFIDGDLIEAFLDLPHDRMEAIARSVGMSVEDLVKRIESLTQSLH